MSFSPIKHTLHIKVSDLSYHSKIVRAFIGTIQKRLNKNLTTDLDCDFDIYTKSIEIRNEKHFIDNQTATNVFCSVSIKFL